MSVVADVCIDNLLWAYSVVAFCVAPLFFFCVCFFCYFLGTVRLLMCMSILHNKPIKIDRFTRLKIAID